MNQIVQANRPVALSKEQHTQLRQEAELLMRGGAITPDCKTVEQALMKIRTGYDMGLTPTQSMNFTYIMNGKVLPYGQGAPYLLRRHGYSVQYKEETGKCTAIVTSRNGEEYTETVTFEEAQASGYTTALHNGKPFLKAGWKPGHSRKLKLRYLAISTLIKTYIPEVLCGAPDFYETFTDVDLDAPKNEIKSQDYTEYDQARQEEEIVMTEIQEGEIVEEITEEMANITMDSLSQSVKDYINTMGEYGYDADESLSKLKNYYKKEPQEITDQQVSSFLKAVIKKLTQ